MSIEVKVHRNAGHPWDGRTGFDIMEINADSQEEMARAESTAKCKYWQPWLVGVNEGSGLPGGVFYKPCGIAEPWEDGPEHPHPGATDASLLDFPLNPN